MDFPFGPFVLVPGGAGFLGSHLCDRLLERGHCVLAFDDFSTGARSNLQHLQGHARFRLLVGDVSDVLPAAITAARRVFNLACPASPAYYRRDPMRTVLSGVIGTWRLLELCQRTGARLLQASTGEVYGDPQQHPQAEDYFGHVNPIFLGSQRPRLIKIPPMVMHGWKALTQPEVIVVNLQSHVYDAADEFKFEWNCVLEQVWEPKNG